MPTTLELCEKYFGTRDIYELMNLKKDAIEKDGKCFFVLLLKDLQTTIVVFRYSFFLV